jgi:hypothetical protein
MGKWGPNYATLFQLASVVIALIPGLLIFRYGVNLPVFDDWDVAYSLHVAAERGDLLAHLPSQANECRPVFPRIIFFLLAKLFHGDMRAPMYASWVLVCFGAWCIWRLARPLAGKLAAPASVLAMALIFSPIQAENWMWGNQLMLFLPIVCLAFALLILFQLKSKPPVMIVSSLALCTVATFSFTNGFLCWLAILPGMMISPVMGQDSRWRARALIIWTISLAANLFFYFRTFHPDPNRHDPLLFLKRPVDGVIYFLSFLGSPLANHQPRLAVIVGALLISGLVWATWHLSRRQRNPKWLAAAPFVIIAAFSIASAALATSGRLALGVAQAFSSRYTTIGIYAFVSALVLFAGIAASQEAHEAKRRLRITTCILAVIAIATLQVRASIRGFEIVKHNANAARFARACLALSNVAEGDCKYYRVYPDPNVPRSRAPVLERMGLFHPGLYRGAVPDPTKISRVIGSVSDLTPEPENKWRIHGWVKLANSLPPPDAVVVAVQEGTTAPPQPVGVGYPQLVDSVNGPLIRFQTTIQHNPGKSGAKVYAYAFHFKTESWNLIGDQRLPLVDVEH